MKFVRNPRISPTPAERLRELLRLQHEALLRVIQRDTKRAPCRNRTYNLMIKSQIRDGGLTRTGSAQPLPAPINIAALVPQEYPIAARTSTVHHLSFSIPDPFADEKIWMVYGWVL